MVFLIVFTDSVSFVLFARYSDAVFLIVCTAWLKREEWPVCVVVKAMRNKRGKRKASEFELHLSLSK